ncbi:DUF6317 family protein [Mangrovihabitans endophyticus]|uniref:Uncharacterized protein n=1 Tax=Mangrovihabitans endophyticus TaxID=1751298 RepID=A0A8J3BZR8_9ACTN|nr:DUF6317 family protein [Mangrovihabitans endophyticus]GGK87965.1 hypothetical protein GCM10012284_22540 [Mangrovihabitans endophyticus]
MGDDYHVAVSRGTALADTFARAQDPLLRLAAPLRGACEAIRTGDAGLDAETAAVARRVDGLYRLMAQVFATLSANVSDAVADYRDADEAVAAAFRELMSDDTATTPSGPPPVRDNVPVG